MDVSLIDLDPDELDREDLCCIIRKKSGHREQKALARRPTARCGAARLTRRGECGIMDSVSGFAA